MTVLRSVPLFVLAALAEIGARLVWQGWREHHGLWWIAAGVITLGAYGVVPPSNPTRTSVVSPPCSEFGRRCAQDVGRFGLPY